MHKFLLFLFLLMNTFLFAVGQEGNNDTQQEDVLEDSERKDLSVLSLSLQEALRLAQEKSLLIEEQEIEFDFYRSQIENFYTTFLPQFGIYGTINFTEDHYISSLRPDNVKMFGSKIGAYLEWNKVSLDIVGEYQERIINLRKVRLEKEIVKKEVLQQIKLAYANLILQRSFVMKVQKDLLNKEWKYIELGQAVSEKKATELEKEAALLDYEEALINVENVELLWKKTNNEFKALLGISPGEDFILEDDFKELLDSFQDDASVVPLDLVNTKGRGLISQRFFLEYEQKLIDRENFTVRFWPRFNFRIEAGLPYDYYRYDIGTKEWREIDNALHMAARLHVDWNLTYLFWDKAVDREFTYRNRLVDVHYRTYMEALRAENSEMIFLVQRIAKEEEVLKGYLERLAFREKVDIQMMQAYEEKSSLSSIESVYQARLALLEQDYVVEMQRHLLFLLYVKRGEFFE